MSWIRAESNTLLNLEYIQAITVSELEEPEGGRNIDDPTHGVFADDAEDESWLLFKGDEGYCLAKQEQLAAKLPMVKS